MDSNLRKYVQKFVDFMAAIEPQGLSSVYSRSLVQYTEKLPGNIKYINVL